MGGRSYGGFDTVVEEECVLDGDISIQGQEEDDVGDCIRRQLLERTGKVREKETYLEVGVEEFPQTGRLSIVAVDFQPSRLDGDTPLIGQSSADLDLEKIAKVRYKRIKGNLLCLELADPCRGGEECHKRQLDCPAPVLPLHEKLQLSSCCSPFSFPYLDSFDCRRLRHLAVHPHVDFNRERRLLSVAQGGHRVFCVFGPLAGCILKRL